MILSRSEIRIGSLDLKVIHLNQVEMGITVTEEMGHLVLIDTKASPEMSLLSSLLKHCHDSDDVLYLQRTRPENADLFIFNGAVTPLNRKLVKEIKMALKRSTLRGEIDLTVESHSCAHLASSLAGHSHFDWYSTSSSPELIIRNMARND